MDWKRKQKPGKLTPAARIVAERRALLERLAMLDGSSPVRERGLVPGDNTPWADPTEQVREGIARIEVLATREALLERLKALARAQEKIREGTYGQCDTCGNPIPAARLRALPAAACCVPCAERGG